MDRIVNYLFLQYCKAWDRDDEELTNWYFYGWQWLEKFYDESKETSQQMASGTESILAESRDAELLRDSVREVHQPVSVTVSQLETSQDHDTGTVSRNSLGV